MNREQGPRAAGMRTAVNDAGRRPDRPLNPHSPNGGGVMNSGVMNSGVMNSGVMNNGNRLTEVAS